MHPNPIYSKQDPEIALSQATARGFGVVTANLDTLFGAHVPFVASDPGTLHLHLMRANPLARAATKAPVPVMLIVSLCDAYVSPQWYQLGPDQVPTWLYGAVHIHGHLQALADEELAPVLSKLSEEFERRLAPKPPWTLDKMSDKAKAQMMRAIQPFSLTITKVEATDKFAQNKPNSALKALAEDLPQSFGGNLDQVVRRLRNLVGL